jgi:hypothetical protein
MRLDPAVVAGTGNDCAESLRSRSREDLMADVLDPQVMVFAPCQRAEVEPDRTVTLHGMFTRISSPEPTGPISMDFNVVSLLTGGLGNVTVEALLVAPDGAIRWQGSTFVNFVRRQTIHAVQWRLQAIVEPGEFELQLVFDHGSAAVALPIVVGRR